MCLKNKKLSDSAILYYRFFGMSGYDSGWDGDVGGGAGGGVQGRGQYCYDVNNEGHPKQNAVLESM